MPVGYVLKQAGIKLGLDPTVEGDRAVLLRIFNEAANELYDQADVDECMEEGVFQVNGDQQVAFPPTVGPLRAMREYTTHVTWRMSKPRTRYNPVNWKDRWRNWRIKGTSPIMYPVVNQSVFNVSFPDGVLLSAIDTPPVVVTITGPTQFATSVSENVVMDAVIKQTTTPFQDIKAIKKNRVSNYDLNITDAGDILMASIPNNMLQMRYTLVDVSLYPWTSTAQSVVDHWMEVLFKKALPWFANDEDEFPMLGYDNVLVNKMLQLVAEEQGKGQEALAYDAKATRTMARKKEDALRGVEDEACLAENPHDTLLPRNRPLGPARYTGQTWY